MSGPGKALDRLRAHEERRNGRRAWAPPPPDEELRLSREERAWIDANPLAAVRAMNEVDRAVKAGRRAREAA